MEGNLRFKIDWVSLIVGRKFTVFALFYFVFDDQGNGVERSSRNVNMIAKFLDLNKS